MKLITRILALIIAVSLVGTSILPVLAGGTSGDSATNDTTGADSTNKTSVQNVNEVKVTNVSDAFIKNEVRSYANTGNNSASKNTMGGMIQTGDAKTDVSILNSANINTNIIDLGRTSGANTAGNSITGAESQNFADILNKNKVTVKNDNTAVLLNDVEAKSNTGGNLADKNTDGIGGKVQTGDAITLVDVINRANDSATAVRGLANFGSSVVGNSITGFDSMNVANIKNLNEVAVTNVSDAFVLNHVRAKATTGNNTASKNTMGGLVQTGDALADVSLLTDANINTTSIDNGLAGSGSTSGNSITGAESQNFTDLLNKNTFKVENFNNKGKSMDAGDYECIKSGDKHCVHNWGVVNFDEDIADTGMNLADKNTYPSSIATGIALVGKYIRVCLNDTMTSIGDLLP